MSHSGRLRVVVCGTTFGQVYLRALARMQDRCELVGIVARGSERSHACAARHGVALFSSVEDLPERTDAACVVVRSSAMGGHGQDLVRGLLQRGIHVLQEHPVHAEELAENTRHAAERGLIYRLNTFYPNVDAVRRFIRCAQALREQHPALFVDATCAIQVAYPMLDILGQALGCLRPYALSVMPHESEGAVVPFRTVLGTFGGVPIALRVQNQLDPGDPDNHVHVLHRVTLVTDAGSLSLTDTHGPVTWSPRMHVPAPLKERFDVQDGVADGLELMSSAAIGPASGLPYRDVFGTLWPDAVARAIDGFAQDIAAGETGHGHGQYHLSLSRAWQLLTRGLGYPELIRSAPPTPLPARKLEREAEGRVPA